MKRNMRLFDYLLTVALIVLSLVVYDYFFAYKLYVLPSTEQKVEAIRKDFLDSKISPEVARLKLKQLRLSLKTEGSRLCGKRNHCLVLTEDGIVAYRR